VLIVERHYLQLTRHHPVLRSFQRTEHFVRVVVPPAEVSPDVRSPQPLLCQLDPGSQPLLGQRVEQSLDTTLVSFVLPVLVGIALEPVVPQRLQALLELSELLGTLKMVLLALEARPPAPSGIPDDGDEKLPHEVPPEHQRVDLVELRGVQELAVRDLRAVDVRGIEDSGGFSRLLSLLGEQAHPSPP
jgi:hypothetical protein